MPDPAVTFRELLHPMGVDEFFAAYTGRRHLHIPGGSEKAQSLFDWAAFNRVLDMTPIWTDRTIKLALDGDNIEPMDFCRPGRSREGAPAMTPDWGKVAQLMRQGASMVLDTMERLHPGVQALTTALQMGMASKVFCNAYCSWSQRQAFRSHFDTTEVFALHIEGKKVWRLYEGRFEHPIEAGGYSYGSLPLDYHEKAKGGLLEEIEMTPGDLLYIPKGQYHDALAASDACLHLSFGTARPTGLDFMRTVMTPLREDPAFRADMPGIDDPRGYYAHVATLAGRISELMRQPDVADKLFKDQKSGMFDNIPRLSIPHPDLAHPYRVKPYGWARKKRGAAVFLIHGGEKTELAPDLEPLAEWILARDIFTMAEIEASFPDIADKDRRELVAALRRLALVTAA